jgi:hypothetical protein
MVFVDPNGVAQNFRVILPTVGVTTGQEFLIKNINTSLDQYTITVTTDAGEEYGSNYLENPITGAFAVTFDFNVRGESHTWIFDGTTYRHLAELSPAPIFYSSTSSYHQVVLQNPSDANNASSDWVAYNDQGNFAEGTGPFIDMGINSSQYTDTTYGNIWGPNDSYLYNNGGNLIIAAGSPNTSIKLAVGDTNVENIRVDIDYFGVNFKNTSGNQLGTIQEVGMGWLGLTNGNTGYPVQALIKSNNNDFLNNDLASILVTPSNANNTAGEVVLYAINHEPGGGNYTWNFSPNGVLNLPDEVGDIHRDGVSVLAAPVAPPAPSISYTGTFGNAPTFWAYSQPQKLQYTSNNSFADVSSLYWLNQNFDDQWYDLSGLESISFNNIGGISGYLDFSNKTEVVLESINLGSIAAITDDFYLSGFGNVLNSFSANNLSFIGDYVEFYGNGWANTLSVEFPSLKTIGGQLSINYNYGTSDQVAPSMPALDSVGTFYVYYNRFKQWPDFTSLTTIRNNLTFNNNYNGDFEYSFPAMPALVNAKSEFYIRSNTNMVNIPSFDSLVRIWGNAYIDNNPSITTFPAFPVLENIGNVFVGDNCTSATSFDGGFLPSIKRIGNNVSFYNCALDQTTVDAILIKLASLDGNEGTTLFNHDVNLSGGTNATRSSASDSAYSTLVGRGCNLYLN